MIKPLNLYLTQHNMTHNKTTTTFNIKETTDYGTKKLTLKIIYNTELKINQKHITLANQNNSPNTIAAIFRPSRSKIKHLRNQKTLVCNTVQHNHITK